MSASPRPDPQATARTKLESGQLQSVQETLRWVRDRSPFYRQRHAGLPLTLFALDEIAQFPFTTADDIAADPLRFVCISQTEVSRVVTLQTSGTTGQPKRLFFNEADQEVTLEYFRRGLSAMVEPGERALVLLPSGRPGGLGDLLNRSLRSLGTLPTFADAAWGLVATAATLVRMRPALVIGAPVPVFAVCQEIARSSSMAPKVKSVLLCSDDVPEPVVRTLEERWHCEVFLDWGMTEMGYGGGVECHAHNGYHLQEADFLFEIVEPVSGRPVPEGELGEIVFTTLARRAMPLIRYRTGDISRFLPGACACGSPLRRLGAIHGRRSEQVVLQSGEVLSLHELDGVLFGTEGLVDFDVRFFAGRPDRLLLAVSSVSGQDSAAETVGELARRALDSIETIRAARTAGRLQVEMTVAPGPFILSRGKRHIRRAGTA